MARFVPFAVGGIVAVAAMQLGPAASQYLGVSPSSAQTTSASTMLSAAGNKGDRFAVTRAQADTLEVATVEVIGLGEPAIVYRHRDGRELFRTDPIDNVTVVTKGFVLPQVTVRRDARSPVKPVRMLDIDAQRDQTPARNRPTPTKAPSGDPKAMPTGCESAFSPVASPDLAHHLGRCMAGNTNQSVLAMRAG